MSPRISSSVYSFLIVPILTVFLVPRHIAQILTPGTKVEQPEPGDTEGGCTLTAAAGIEMAPQILALQRVMPQAQITAMTNLVVGLDQLMQVNPKFAMYNDGSSPNAFATPAVIDRLYKDGTVMFGARLFGLEMQETPSGNFTVSAIMAHEFGHILQFKYGENLPTKQKELEADYVAGWYVGHNGIWTGAASSQALMSFYNKGDYEFNSETHHGTPEERFRAVQAGLRDARSPLRQMFENAHDFVTSN